MNNLMQKINDRTACIGVIGLGYVGLPLSMAFSKHFNTIGYDVYEKCITSLRSGKSHILDVADTTLQKYINNSFIVPPLDPFYMSYRAKKFGFIPRLIETSGEINNFMKIHAVNLIEKELSKVNKRVYGSQVAVLGLAYKKNINDTRESPSVKIIKELVNLGSNVKVYDPFVNSIKTTAGRFYSESTIEEALNKSDCAIFVTDHDVFRDLDLKEVCKIMKYPICIDCKNLFQKNENLICFGIGK